MSTPDAGNARSRRTSAPRAKRRSPAPPPPVDERIVMPESRFEIIDGRVEYVAPADEPHGTCQSKLAALLEAHIAEGYTAAVEMLTRTSEKGDMAPDASVFPSARDEATGGRKLEELAFEIVSTERLNHAAKKARALHGRGVRRVFAVDVKRRRVLSWSPPTNAWEILSNDATIEDPALAVALPLRALVDTARADDAIAAALLAKKNPVIEGALHEAEARGEALGIHAGKVAALLAVLGVKGFALTEQDRERVRKAGAPQLDAWLQRAVTASSLEEALR
jgi:Uma2 family endonuclease